MRFSRSKLKRFFALAGIIALVFGLTFGAYLMYLYDRNNMELSAEIAALQSQLSALDSALQNSASVGEANKKQLQEIAKRNGLPAPAPAPNTNKNPPASSLSSESSLTAAVAKAAPAVVSIVISKDVPLLEVQRYVNPFSDQPAFRNLDIKMPVYEQVGTKKQEIGAGSGFILTSDGYIVTNNHVVSDPKADYTAVLSSGEKKAAEVVHRDSPRDIAILKISGEGYSAIQLGDSSELKLGQTVAAIGNALGEYNNSVSVGIVSGLNRTIEAVNPDGEVEKLSGIVQTDAAINRGNSGGPLIDLAGQAVGINVAMELGANNISFAIPVNTVKAVVSQAIPSN